MDCIIQIVELVSNILSLGGGGGAGVPQTNTPIKGNNFDTYIEAIKGNFNKNKLKTYISWSSQWTFLSVAFPQL